MGGVYGLGGNGAHRDLVAHDLTAVVSDISDVAAFAQAADSLRTQARIHVKLDTGMSRLGLRPAQLQPFLEACTAFPQVVIAGFCTHLASADSDPEQTRHQLELFEAAIPLVRAHVPGELLLHAANSAGTLNYARARYDAVRPGIALYCGAEPAMRFVTAVAQLHDLEPGDTVSYGALWRAPGRARVATLPVGYADGYPRRLTGHSEVLLHGHRCPVVGAVCMDMTIVDVTALGDSVAIGDEAVLLGRQGEEHITTAELAAHAGLIEYEITCGISKRVPRIFKPPR
jgi:alanine racemase